MLIYIINLIFQFPRFWRSSCPVNWQLGLLGLLGELMSCSSANSEGSQHHTVDGRIPAITSWGWSSNPLFTWFYTSQVVVWDFRHQQYHHLITEVWCYTAYETNMYGFIFKASVFRPLKPVSSWVAKIGFFLICIVVVKRNTLNSSRLHSWKRG